MSGSAKVLSLDVLETMAVALRGFGEDATAILADLGMDVHRAVQWIQYEMRDYWTAELRRAQQAVEEARLALERKRMFHIGDRPPDCREEKMALEAAKRRVERARRKLEAVKRWSRLIEKEFMDYKGAVAPLAGWLQVDLPRAVALLKRMGQSLDAYVAIQSALDAAAQTSPPAPSAPSDGPVAQATPPGPPPDPADPTGGAAGEQAFATQQDASPTEPEGRA